MSFLQTLSGNVGEDGYVLTALGGRLKHNKELGLYMALHHTILQLAVVQKCGERWHG
jgi:hypothetical protein